MTREEPETYSSSGQYLLWSVRLKATPGRIALIEVLEKEHGPILAADLKKKMPRGTDRVSLYRALQALVGAGLVNKINASSPYALYELRLGRKHHHHAICTICGQMEDISGCESQELNDAARRSAKSFANIQTHSLEFFGLCKKCASAA